MRGNGGKGGAFQAAIRTMRKESEEGIIFPGWEEHRRTTPYSWSKQKGRSSSFRGGVEIRMKCSSLAGGKHQKGEGMRAEEKPSA